MALTPTEVRFAPTGHVYVGDEGVTLPTDPDAALAAGLLEVGYITEDGVSMTPNQDWNDIRAWQSALPVKKALNESSFELSFSMEQVNIPVTELFFGSTWSNEGGGVTRLDLSSNPSQDVKVIVVDWTDDEGDVYRLVVPRAQVTNREAIQLQRAEAKVFGVTIEALDSAGTFAYLLSDNPDLLPAS